MENKEKQIEEMTRDICEIQYKGMKCGVCDTGCDCRMMSEALYNAGYRKKIQGEWKPIMQELNCCDTLECSICEFVIDISQGDYNYCPNCGAKMKGA